MQLVVSMLHCENIHVIAMMNQMSLMEGETATRSVEMVEKKWQQALTRTGRHKVVGCKLRIGQYLIYNIQDFSQPVAFHIGV